MANPPLPAHSLDHIGPWSAGGCGGALTALLNFFGTTAGDFVSAVFDGDILAMKLFTAFLFGLFGFGFCGGLIGYFLQAWTRNRWAWFAVSLAITSTGSTAIPTIGNFLKRADISPISIAYAQEQNPSCDNIKNFTIWDGLSQYLGLREPHYRVVVGSFKKWDDAAAFANKINAQDSTLHASVGEKAPCNDFYAVIVGPLSSSLADAKQLQSKVQKLDFGANAYVSFRPS